MRDEVLTRGRLPEGGAYNETLKGRLPSARVEHDRVCALCGPFGGLYGPFVERTVAVEANAEIDLADRVDTVAGCDVEEHADFDTPALHERERLQDVSAGRELAGQWLVHPGELGGQQ